MTEQIKKQKGMIFNIDFDLCGLCVGEVRELLKRAENKEKVSIRIIKTRTDYLTHIEVLK